MATSTGEPLDLDAITAEMIEAAAVAEYRCDMAREESDDFEPITWDEALTSVRHAYRQRAGAGLAAALSVCEVRQERRYGECGDECTHGLDDSPPSDQVRLLFTTPWREVPQ